MLHSEIATNIVQQEAIGCKHAIVIGGSIAGLLVARVLADHFDRVTVVERDRFPEGSQRQLAQRFSCQLIRGK